MDSKKLNILIVDDDELYRLGLGALLGRYGTVNTAHSLNSGLQLLEKQNFDIAFLDMTLDTGLEGLEMVRACFQRGIYSVVLSGHDSNEIIEDAYECGCQDYFQKGNEEEYVTDAIAKYHLNHNRFQFESFIKNDFITSDAKTIEELEAAFNNSTGKIPIFISGATGTGKTMLARLIHNASKRKGQFIQINCSEINPNLIESELFGHKKGSFTGAISDKEGRLKLADGGTLFIDEICSMPINIQVKMLKALEEQSFYPVGSKQTVTSNFRIISASQQDIIQKINSSEFRADLYHRISGFNVHLRPLRERKNDIPLIAQNRMKNSRRIVIKDDAMEKLMEYKWPGNVRQLLTTIDLLKSKNKGIIRSEDLPTEILNNNLKNKEQSLLTENQYSTALELGLGALIEKIEKEILQRTLKEHGNSVRTTMRALNISNRKFYGLKEKFQHE